MPEVLALASRGSPELDRTSSEERMVSRITFVVLPTPPFRLDLTVWTARRRSGNAVDRWDGHVDRRVLVLDGTPVEIAVEHLRSPGPLRSYAGQR